MTRSLQLAVLGSALLVILSVQVLPELDLSDTALHRGTAPFLTKSRVTPTPAVLERHISGLVRRYEGFVQNPSRTIAIAHCAAQQLPSYPSVFSSLLEPILPKNKFEFAP